MDGDDIACVIYTPAGPDADRHRRECAAHARRRGYRIASITHSPDAVVQEIASGRVQRIVIARPEHLRALAAEHVEIVTEIADLGSPRHRRRTSRERRDSEGP